MKLFATLHTQFAGKLLELRYGASFLRFADFLVLLFIGLAVVSALTSIYVVIALISFLQVKKSAQLQMRAAKKCHKLRQLPVMLKQIALSYMVIGIFSILVASRDLRYGCYLCSLCGLGIFLCGLERFKRL